MTEPVAEPKKVDGFTGMLHRFKLRVMLLRVLEFEDVLFRHNSSVFLPDREDVETLGDDAQEKIAGLDVVKALLMAAHKFPEEKLLIAGHTDTSGGEQINVTISKERAHSVLHVIEDNKDAWVTIVEGRHKVEDIQHILRWAGHDPGPVDGIVGPQTRAATKSFQKEAGIGQDGIVGPLTWGKFFEKYQAELKDLMEDTDEGKEALAMRGSINFLLPGGAKAVGCGETWPIENVGDSNYRSQINRRVEAMFFAETEIPKIFDCGPDACMKKECPLYNKEEYRRDYIDPEGRVKILFNLRWSKEKVRCGDTVELLASCKNIQEGEKIDLLVRNTATNAEVAKLPGTVKNKAVECTWVSQKNSATWPSEKFLFEGSTSRCETAFSIDPKLEFERAPNGIKTNCITGGRRSTPKWIRPTGSTTWVLGTGSYGWDANFDAEFKDGLMTITGKIKLIPKGGLTITAAMKSTWKSQIEGFWNNVFQAHREACKRDDSCSCNKDNACCKYQVKVICDFVESGEHVRVDCHKGAATGTWGSAAWWYSSTWWELHGTFGPKVRAHEFGHCIGLFDEYAGGATIPGLNPNTATFDSTSLMNGGTKPLKEHYRGNPGIVLADSWLPSIEGITKEKYKVIKI